MFIIGFLSKNRNEIRQALEDTLGFDFVLRESLYIGQYESYTADNQGAGKITYLLRDNIDPVYGGVEIPSAAQFQVLLLVDGVPHTPEFEMKMTVLGGKLLPEEELR